MTAAPISPYRRPLTIDHTRVRNTDQRNFPVLIRLSDPTLRSTAAGGHVAHDQGADLFFTQADGRHPAASRTGSPMTLSRAS